MAPYVTDRGGFKKGISPKLAQRSRYETTLQIRNMKKNEQLMKRRRNPGTAANATATTAETTITTTSTAAMTNALGKRVKLNSIDETISALMSNFRYWLPNRSTVAADTLLDLLQETRRLLTGESELPIGKLLAQGILPFLADIVRTESRSDILFEAIWIFINISSSNDPSHAQAVAQSGAVPDIAKLLGHESAGVREQAIWFIANMAGESVTYRDALLELQTVVNGIVYNLDHPANLSTLANCAWAISNLLRGSPKSRTDVVVRFIPGLVYKFTYGVTHSVPAKDLVDMMCALAYLVENSPEASAAVFQTGLPSTLVKAVECYSQRPNSTALLCPAVRVLGSFASTTDDQTEEVVRCGFLKHALGLLEPSKKRALQRDALFALSNIAAGTTDQIGALLRQHSLMVRIVQLAEDSPLEVTKEALWVLTNIVTKGNYKQANAVVAHGCIPAFCRYLNPPRDTKLVLVVLEALDKLLAYNREIELGYVELIEDSKGIDALEELQMYNNEKVCELAVRILVTYFNAEEEQEDQNIAPIVSEGDTTFEFGISALPSKQLFPLTAGSSAPAMQFDFGGSVNMNAGQRY